MSDICELVVWYGIMIMMVCKGGKVVIVGDG